MDEQSPPVTEISAPQDTIARGCAMGCGWGLLAAAISGGLAYVLDNKPGEVALVSCRLTQWIAIVPAILNQKRKGYRQSPKGLIIAGCIGVLLASTCAALLLNPPDFK